MFGRFRSGEAVKQATLNLRVFLVNVNCTCKSRSHSWFPDGSLCSWPGSAGAAPHQSKFGDGWIKGRYEWSFEQNSPITIHSSRNDSFSIQDGH